MIGWVLQILKITRKQKKQIEEQIQREAEKQGIKIEPLELKKQAELLALKELASRIRAEAARARQEVLQKLEEIQNPIIKAYIEQLDKKYTEKEDRVALAYIAVREAIRKGLQNNPEKFFKEITKNLILTTHKLSTEYRTINDEDAEKEGLYWFYTGTLDPFFIVSDGVRVPLYKVYKEMGIEEAKKYRDMIYEIEGALSAVKKDYQDYWNLSPEEHMAKALPLLREAGLDIEEEVRKIEEEKIEAEEEAKPTPGARILAHPDRYPTLTQKILLKTLILGELQRENNKGVDRNLYRAIRNLLTTPLTTANWYPLLTEWFENLEKGQHTSPLTHIIQKLPIDPRLKQQAYKYLALIEQGTPLNQIPSEEKQAFRQAIEKVKQDIWRNPGKYQPIIDQLLYTTGLNTREAIKTLIGVIDDLARIHTGEKTPRQIGILRDATQILHTIRNLEGKNHYIDPYWITNTLTRIINENIQDPLLRKAYYTTIQHYQQTNHQIPRNQEYLEKIIEKERELEEKLRKLQEGEEKLDELEVKRIGNLYRILMLLTPHPTLEETKRFYNQIARQLTVKVGNEEFLPVHGPIAEDLATTYSRIRTAPPEKKEEIVRREIAKYEPVLFITPHIERGVNNILAKPYGKLIPMEEHEKFLTHLERTQMRRPIEK